MKAYQRRAELRRLAEAATPGPWVIEGGEMVSRKGVPICDPYMDQNNAAYIAAASPDVVLRLLDRIEELEVELATEDT